MKYVSKYSIEKKERIQRKYYIKECNSLSTHILLTACLSAGENNKKITVLQNSHTVLRHNINTLKHHF